LQQSNTTSLSPVGMNIQFRTLTFHSRPEEQIQERLRLKKSTTSLSAVIGALDSPLAPRPERDLATDLYSISTPIAIIDESNHQISFNSLKKFMTSLLAMIRALGSSLKPRLERDLATYLYSGSIPIAIKMSLIAGSISDDFNKAATSLQEVTKA
jgi:hypothetical protein